MRVVRRAHALCWVSSEVSIMRAFASYALSVDVMYINIKRVCTHVRTHIRTHAYTCHIYIYMYMYIYIYIYTHTCMQLRAFVYALMCKPIPQHTTSHHPALNHIIWPMITHTRTESCRCHVRTCVPVTRATQPWRQSTPRTPKRGGGYCWQRYCCLESLDRELFV